MGKLLEAVISLGSELELAAVLHRLVEVGVELTGARYGALGVLDEEGSSLAEFITVGVDDETRRRIGPPPKGLGLLGALITDARPLRVADLSEYAGRSGFPDHHPPMTSFLGVPIRIRQEVFGNLYLTEKLDGEVFTDVDEELMLGLASAAGVAINNARLFEQVQRREAALAAIQTVATAVLQGADTADTLRFVAEQAGILADAEASTFALPAADGETLVMEASGGPLGLALEGIRFPMAGSVSGDVLRSGGTVVIDDLSQDRRTAQPQVRGGAIGPAIFMALTSAGEPIGTLFVGRALGRPAFGDADVEIVRSFAAQAGVVIESADQRARLGQMSILEEKERIARDLHDTVVQQVFALGLSLNATVGMIPDDLARQRISTAVDDLDDVIRQIRTVIFDVGSAAAPSTSGVRSDVLDLAHESARALGFEPVLVLDGPIDTLIEGAVAQTALATIREALSNVARHARASRVDLSVTVTAETLRIVVTDDGVGLPRDEGHAVGNGLRNMRTRAEKLGGTLEIDRVTPQGTELRWTVPLG